MTKKLLAFAVAFSFVVIAMAHAEEAKKAAPAKASKVTETRLHEADFGRLEDVVKKGVMEGVKGHFANWEYMARSMKPPKNDKWLARWNELGAEGWEAFDHFENIYIFKRPSMGVKSEPVISEKTEKKAQKEKEKAEKNAEKEKAKAEKDAEKAAKKAEKAKEKAAQKAEKEAKKAEKDAQKAAEKNIKK